MIVDAKASADVTGKGEIETRRYTRGSGKNKKTYYDADVYQVDRHVDFTVDDLPLESSRDRGNLDTNANTNNIINTILPFDTKNAVKWNASYLTGCSSEKRDLRCHAAAAAPGRPVAVDRPRAGRGIGRPLRSRRALGAGRPRRAWHALGGDVPARVAVLLPAARRTTAACCTTSP